MTVAKHQMERDEGDEGDTPLATEQEVNPERFNVVYRL